MPQKVLKACSRYDIIVNSERLKDGLLYEINKPRLSTTPELNPLSTKPGEGLRLLSWLRSASPHNKRMNPTAAVHQALPLVGLHELELADAFRRRSRCL